jgi:hypothetical protein
MASEPVARAVAEELARWGGMRQTGVSLRYMTEFGARPTHRNLLLSAQFLHKELPIRIARRALDLDSLPFGLSKKPAVLKVGQSIDLIHPTTIRPLRAVTCGIDLSHAVFPFSFSSGTFDSYGKLGIPYFASPPFGV